MDNAEIIKNLSKILNIKINEELYDELKGNTRQEDDTQEDERDDFNNEVVEAIRSKILFLLTSDEFKFTKDIADAVSILTRLLEIYEGELNNLD